MSFAVVDLASGKVVRQYPSDIAPDPVIWPNGDASHGVAPGFEHAGCRFVSVAYAPDAPGEFYQITETKPSLNGGVLTYVRTWSPSDLKSTQEILAGRVDAAAEAKRMQYITPGSGQALTYQQKLTEALAFASDANPDPAKYPLLAATVGIEGIALSDVAELVTATAAQWTVIAGQIEKVRLSGKVGINAAKSVDDAVAAFSAVAF